MSGIVLCSMPGCQTTAGCLCGFAGLPERYQGFAGRKDAPSSIPAALSGPDALRALPIEPDTDARDKISVSFEDWIDDEMVVAAMEKIPGCDHDAMVDALEAAFNVWRRV